MKYNKHSLKKMNNKNVLNKRWVTLSIAMLGLLGGGALAATSVSANSNSQSNNSGNQTNQLSNMSSQGQQPKLVNSQSNYNNQSNQSSLKGVQNGPSILTSNAKFGNSSTNAISNNKPLNVTNRTNSISKNILSNAINHSNVENNLNSQKALQNQGSIARLGSVNNSPSLSSSNPNYKVTQVPNSHDWFFVNKTILAHTNISSVGTNQDYNYVLHRGQVAKILNTYIVTDNNNNQRYRYAISINNQNYFVTGNPMFTDNNVELVKNRLHWFYVTKTCLAHKHLTSVGQIKDYDYTLHRGDVFKVLKTFVVNNNNKSYYRYEISVNNQKYVVTGNPMFTKNEYMQANELDPSRKAVVKVPCFMYDRPVYTNYDRVKGMHRGQMIRIKKVLHIGKKGHFMTRFELTNGLFITANRKFIKMI